MDWTSHNPVAGKLITKAVTCIQAVQTRLFFQEFWDTAGKGKNKLSFRLNVKTQFEGKMHTLILYNLQGILFFKIDSILVC